MFSIASCRVYMCILCRAVDEYAGAVAEDAIGERGNDGGDERSDAFLSCFNLSLAISHPTIFERICLSQGDSQLDCEECMKARADRGLPGKVKVDAIKYERIKVAHYPCGLVFVIQNFINW